ncbi:toxin-antitoxin system YwqK family antitoxin [Reichenbachiella agariperforans]|uniref:toxin-antitoxin system YwqK family antitoxin n=1 Tax=Reichenbachiella agariperforans TaxID=156994 RepID=UPI001C0A5FED|nr:hypothetical protein [Reichenbachiella agariperforans]MBU2912912.1 hypothetical protein [Reichenbachiella agariperforans]
MKKFLFLILLSACSNEKQIIEKWPDGTFKLQGIKINGVKEGKWIYFRDYNQDTSKIEYYNSGNIYQIDGYAYMTIKDSTTSSTTHLSDRTEYLDSLKHGTQLTFYPDGRIRSKTNYTMNSAEGESLMYSEDGKIEVKSEYNADTLVSFTQFHPNGNIAVKAKNPQNGISTFYDSLGGIKHKVIYQNWRAIDTLTMEQE